MPRAGVHGVAVAERIEVEAGRAHAVEEPERAASVAGEVCGAEGL